MYTIPIQLLPFHKIFMKARKFMHQNLKVEFALSIWNERGSWLSEGMGYL